MKSPIWRNEITNLIAKGPEIPRRAGLGWGPQLRSQPLLRDTVLFPAEREI
jgi:hypothetical protein